MVARKKYWKRLGEQYYDSTDPDDHRLVGFSISDSIRKENWNIDRTKSFGIAHIETANYGNFHSPDLPGIVLGKLFENTGKTKISCHYNMGGRHRAFCQLYERGCFTFNRWGLKVNYMKRNWKNLALDLSIVSIIPVILFAMFSLPTNMREMLIFHRDYLNGYEIFTSHFIHEEFDHLVYNIALFLPVTIFLYCLLSMIMNERKLYYKLLAFSLLLAPILISLIYIPINRYIWPVPRSLGFSGIDAYLVGTLSYGITLLLHERLKINLSYAYYSYIFFIASLFVFTYQNSMKLLIIGILLLTVSICSGFLMTKSIDEKAKKKFKFASSFSLLPYVLLFASSWALFPTQFVQGSAAINFDIHYIGFVLGIIVSNFVSNKNN